MAKVDVRVIPERHVSALPICCADSVWQMYRRRTYTQLICADEV